MTTAMSRSSHSESDRPTGSRASSPNTSNISSPSLAGRVLKRAPDRSNDVAVIGFSFEFPGADSEDALWDILMQGKCVASSFPPDRFHHSRFKDKIRPQKASFVQRDISAFDARYFGMTDDEAIAMDPQLRILLETSFRALENAGIPMQNISGTNASVHTGCFTADYLMAAAKDPDDTPRYSATGMAHSMLSNRISTFFNITGPSITIDTACSSSLVALDMACCALRNGDSSLGIVAGCNLLLTPDLFVSLSSLGFLSPDGVSHSFDQKANGYGRGEGFGVLIIKPIDLAIRDGDTIRAVIRASGTNQNGRTPLALPSKQMQQQLIESTYRKAGLDMSRTHYFEAHGTGTATGDPLEAMAIGGAFGAGREGDDAILIGALKANIGHLEGAAGIAGVIKAILVLERGMIPPIAGLEELNPDIDAEFLKLKFPQKPIPWPKEGLRRASVSSFGFGGTNAHVVLDDAFHYLQARGISDGILPNFTSLQALTCSSSGNSTTFKTQKLFTWSSHDAKTAVRLIELYRQYLEDQGGHGRLTNKNLEDLAYILAQNRTLFTWRVFAVGDSLAQLSEQLQSPKLREPVQAVADPKIGFIFTGQGAQWSGMAKDLMDVPIFRLSVEAADKFLQTLGCSWSVLDVLQSSMTSELPQFNIDEPKYAQTLCTILQVALVDMMADFGIIPATVIGHSSGEIAAAYAAGVICKSSAWKLAYFRGLLSSQLVEWSASGKTPRGAMMAVGLSEESVAPYIQDAIKGHPEAILTIACINSPESVTLSGDHDIIQRLETTLNDQGIFARRLRVPVAYHSTHMEIIGPMYKQVIGTLQPGDGHHSTSVSGTSLGHSSTTMISSVTGNVIDHTELQKPEYWVQNMVSPVQFSSAMSGLCHQSSKKVRKKIDLSHRSSTPITFLVEIGPHSALQGPIRQTIDAMSSESKLNIGYTSAMVRGKPATVTVLEAVGVLHCKGVPVNLVQANTAMTIANQAGDHLRLYGMSKSLRASPLPSLPQYPFDRTQRYWSEPRISRTLRSQSQPYSELLGSPAADWNPLEPRWHNTLSTTSIPWVQDHKINDGILFPAAAMWIMAVEAINQLSLPDKEIMGHEMRDTSILSSLVIPDDSSKVSTQFRLKPVFDSSDKSNGWADFCLYASPGADAANFVEICHGSVRVVYYDAMMESYYLASREEARHMQNRISSAKLSYKSVIDSSELYQKLAKDGYEYGPAFQGIQLAGRDGKGKATASVQLSSQSRSETRPSIIHPCDLDSILQVALPAVVSDGVSTAKSEKNIMKTWVPTYVSKIWFPATGFQQELSRVQVHASSHAQSTRIFESTVEAVPQDIDVDGKNPRPILTISGAELTLISSTALQERKPPSHLARRLCYDLIHLPDHTAMTPSETAEYIRSRTKSSIADELYESNWANSFHKLKLYTHASLSRALSTVTFCQIPPSLPHIQSQYRWIESRLANLGTTSPLNHAIEDDAAFASLATDLSFMSALGAMHVTFHSQIASILRGETDAQDILSNEMSGTILPTEGDVHSPVLREVSMIEEYKNQLHHLAYENLFVPLREYLNLLAHKNPRMKIPEVYAGAGLTTREVLRALVTTGPISSTGSGVPPSVSQGRGYESSGQATCRSERYDFTTNSSTVLDQVQQEDWQGSFLSEISPSGADAVLKRMNFGFLDAHTDPEFDGFEEGGYDLIVAANLSEGTSSVNKCLLNLRRLLKVGGKLILLVMTDPLSTIYHSVLGFLSESRNNNNDWKLKGRITTVEQWDEELKVAGFSGTELAFPSHEDSERHCATLIISSAIASPQQPLVLAGINITAPNLALVITGWSENARPLQPSRTAQQMISKLGAISTNIQATTFMQAGSLPPEVLQDAIIVILHELNHQGQNEWPSLAHLTAQEYAAFKSTFCNAQAIMWVTAATRPTVVGPVRGLARTLRKERPGLVFTTVLLGGNNCPPTLIDTHISHAVENFTLGLATGTCEYELAYSQDSGQLTIPRVYENPVLDNAILHYTSAASRSPITSPSQPFHSPTSNVKLTITKPGLLDSLVFVTGPLPSLPPNHISVRVKAIGLNFRDTLIALGRVDHKTNQIGSECSGTVISVGTDVQHLFTPGDNVLVTACDAFQSIITVDARLAVRIPEILHPDKALTRKMTFPEAATIPTNFLTAYHALVRLARLEKGESVLIHSGAGGTGQAAIQVAQWIQDGVSSGSSKIFVTVSNPTKASLLKRLYHLPDEQILNSRDVNSFAAGLKRLTEGRGVDVIINSLSGDGLLSSWEECLAPHGRFIEIGKRDIFTRGRKLPMWPFGKNISFMAMDLVGLMDDKPTLVGRELTEIVRLFETGDLKVIEPVKKFGIGEVERALRYLQSGKNAGKVVVEVGEGAVVPAIIQPTLSKWRFNPEAAYVIAGGLGAMGRVIARWMASKGAKHLVLLSRSGLRSDDTEGIGFVRQLEDTHGTQIYHPACDISNAESLRKALDDCQHHGMPPIHGCIQAAMVLRDGFFENMDHTSWTEPLVSKMDGSWNLHQQLPRNLDFFILLSSISGIIGSQGQSNYAAGNTYQDELARYRGENLGERAVSVNLSLVGGEGFAIQQPTLAKQLLLTKHIVEMTKNEMLALLDTLCCPAQENKAAARQAYPSQIVMGLDMPQHARARGMDLAGWMHEPMFSALHNLEITASSVDEHHSGNDNGSKGTSRAGLDILAQAQQATSIVEAAEIVSQGLVNKLAKILAISATTLDTAQPLHVYGVDSLLAIEVRNWILQNFKVDLPVFEILGGSSCIAVSQRVAEKVYVV